MEHYEISEDMLRDRKHLNDFGFKKLLTNIRYNIFGKIPTFRKNSRHRRNDRGFGEFGGKYFGNKFDDRFGDNSFPFRSDR